MSLSDQRIPLGKSSYYARLVVLIYGSALILLLNSACFFLLKLVLIAVLLLQLTRILKNATPYPDYLTLGYRKERWFLQTQNEQELIFEKAEIVINAGLFFLLRLTLGKKLRYLVIFFDQLDENSYRLLGIQTRIKNGKSVP